MHSLLKFQFVIGVLHHLYKLRQLRSVNLDSTFVSEAGAEALKKALPQVQMKGKFGDPVNAADVRAITALSDLGAIVRRQRRSGNNGDHNSTVVNIYAVW